MGRDVPFGFRVESRHGPIAELGEVVDLVLAAEGRPAVWPIHGEERPVALGLDLEPVTIAGLATTLNARVIGVDIDVSGVPVWAQATDSNGNTVAETRLDWDTARGQFTGALPALTAGTYRVRVSAESIPHGGDHDPTDIVEVVGEADLTDVVHNTPDVDG